MTYDGMVDTDPFERRHVGKHGAFTVRTNRAHVERCVAEIRPRMGEFWKAEPKLALVGKRRAA